MLLCSPEVVVRRASCPKPLGRDMRPFFWQKMTEESKTPPAEKKPPKPIRGKGRLMTTAEKAECVALWEAGEVTIDDLAKRFKRDPATISKVLADAKAVRGATAKEVIEKARAKVAEDAAGTVSKVAARIQETKEEHYILSKTIANMIFRELRASAAPGGPDIANRAQTIKTLESAAKALKLVREERFAVLGILNGEEIDTESLPDLVIQELSADDVATLRSMGGEEGMDDVGGEEVVDESLGDDLDIEDDDAVVEGGDD